MVKGFKDSTRTQYVAGTGSKGPGLKGAAKSGSVMKNFKAGCAPGKSRK